MIVTVTSNQFLTALSEATLNRLLLEDDASSLLLEDGASSLLTEYEPWVQSISADPNSPDWIELYSARLIRVGDPLYVKIQIALGFTSTEMSELFDAALQVPR